MIDHKYHLFSVFLYLKTGLQKTIQFKFNNKTYIHGYHNNQPISIISSDTTKYNTIDKNQMTSLWEEFIRMQDNNPNLNYKDLIRNTCTTINDLPKEIIALIAKEIKLKDLYNFCLSGRKVWQSSKAVAKEMKIKYGNELVNFINQFPNKDWNFYLLSQNPNITIDIVLEYNRGERWNWINLSINPGITFEDMLKYPELFWDSEYVP